MLENEPESSERAGTQPAGDSTDTSASAGEVAGTDTTGAETGEAPATTTRRRSARRRTVASSQPEAPVDAAAGATPASPESQPAEAPVAGDPDAAPKTTRRRRKATSATAAAEPAAADPAAGGAAEAVPPAKKTTRTRRRKTAAVAEGPATEETGTSAEPTPATAPAASTNESGTAENTDQPTSGEPVTVRVEAPTGNEPAVRDGTPQVAATSAGSGAARPAVTPTGAGTPEPPAAVEEETPTRRRRPAITPPVVLFMAPEPDALTVRVTPTAEEAAEEETEGSRRRRRGRRDAEPVQVEAEEEPVAEEETDDTEDEDEETPTSRRRRRRGRRGRGRGRGGADEGEDEETEEPAAARSDEETAEAETDGDNDSDEEDDTADGLTRRRRRRRRRGAGDVEAAATDDGVPTVVRIREPRKTVDEVQGVSGSTRLEAKRQRRRDGREQRRTRPPILSESEFLARREAVDRVMVVRQRGDRTQIGVLEDGVLVEHYVTRNSSGTMAGNVYLGKVQNVLPSMEAAFVDIGRGRNAVLYAGEVNWDTTGLEGRARSIEQALKSGDSVLVQVTKDPIGHKGARLTSHIALSGRHLVYVPGGNASGISRKLPDTERKRLRDILKKLVPEGAGVIVRTAAEGATEDELARDVKRLQAQWEDIQAKAAAGGAPALLYEEPDLVIRVVRDLFNEDFRELVIEGDTAYDMVESYLSHVSPDLVERLRRHTGTTDVFATYRIDEQILKGLDRKVFLPSGGHLVIDRTEAMTVVDVNTGKYTGAGGNLEETVTRNNLEAAEEIVRQLRLRDIGGIVVIDFIDMVLESNRELVLRRLTECLGRDRTKHQVTEITSLGLVQMTRKRIGAGLLEAFSETCECCKGRGLIIHTEPVPEKPRSGGSGEKNKSSAASTTAGNGSSSAEQNGSSRRRGRRSAAAPEPEPERSGGEEAAAPAPTVEPAAPATPAASAVPAATTDPYEDTMGYDLSRYESDPGGAAGGSGETQRSESTTRLAAADDPDALVEGESDDELAEAGSGRRRSRRGGARRRTRP